MHSVKLRLNIKIRKKNHKWQKTHKKTFKILSSDSNWRFHINCCFVWSNFNQTFPGNQCSLTNVDVLNYYILCIWCHILIVIIFFVLYICIDSLKSVFVISWLVCLCVKIYHNKVTMKIYLIWTWTLYIPDMKNGVVRLTNISIIIILHLKWYIYFYFGCINKRR